MRSIRLPKPPPLTALIQAASLRNHARFGITKATRHRVNWRGTIRPSDYGRAYEVEMEYLIGGVPKVWVRSPDLKPLAGDRALPHMYDQETQRLCLYLPGKSFWTPRKPVGCTVIPWAALWLYDFEIWLVTNVWHTSGRHPLPDPDPDPKDS